MFQDVLAMKFLIETYHCHTCEVEHSYHASLTRSETLGVNFALKDKMYLIDFAFETNKRNSMGGPDSRVSIGHWVYQFKSAYLVLQMLYYISNSTKYDVQCHNSNSLTRHQC